MKLPYLIAFGKPAGHRELAPRELDGHSRWAPARKQKRKEGGSRRIRKEDEEKPENGSGLCGQVCCNSLLTVYHIRGQSSARYYP